MGAGESVTRGGGEIVLGGKREHIREMEGEGVSEEHWVKGLKRLNSKRWKSEYKGARECQCKENKMPWLGIEHV